MRNPDLTPRETQVLYLVADGLANYEIARRLGIEERTVRTHMSRIFSKLQIGNRVEAARFVWMKHILALEAEVAALRQCPPDQVRDMSTLKFHLQRSADILARMKWSDHGSSQQRPVSPGTTQGRT